MPVKQSLRSKDLKKSESKPIKTTKKAAVKAETKVTAPKVAAPKKTSLNLSVPAYSLAGRESGTLSLPKEIFGKVVNKKLLSQALRVYMANKKILTASTKTRGEVQGSTAKVWRQKGTGRARHGSKRAPIFVGGGITFGPNYRDVKLELPKKMRKAALLNALSSKLVDKDIFGVSGFEKASGKTKEIAEFVKKINIKNILIITGDKQDNVVRAVKNLSGVDILPANLINAFEVLRHNKLLITKEAVEKLVEGGKKNA